VAGDLNFSLYLPVLLCRAEAVQWGLWPASESPQATASEESPSLNDPVVSIEASARAQNAPEQPETPEPSPQVDPTPSPAETPIQPRRRGAREQFAWDLAVGHLRGILEVRGDPLNPIEAGDGWRSEADAGRQVQDYMRKQLVEQWEWEQKKGLNTEPKKEPDFSTVMRHVRPELKRWREREKHNRA
jgi:hypothetical protein